MDHELKKKVAGCFKKLTLNYKWTNKDKTAHAQQDQEQIWVDFLTVLTQIYTRRNINSYALWNSNL